jgi:hypothetical protein
MAQGDGMVSVSGRQVAPTDAVLMGTGALMLVDGFLPWYGVDIGPFGDFTVKGLSSGFFAWLPIVLVVAVGALVAARVFAGRSLPVGRVGSVGPAALALAGSGLATVLLLLKLLTDNEFTRYGIYLGILLAAVQAWYAYRAFRASGEVVPSFGRGAGSA